MAHPCVISRLMSYRTYKSINRSDLYASLRKKHINKKGTKTLYFTHMPRSPQWMDLYQIWFRGFSRGRNQLCGILLQWAHGFWFCDGVKIHHLSLTWLVAVNTVMALPRCLWWRIFGNFVCGICHAVSGCGTLWTVCWCWLFKFFFEQDGWS